MNIIKKNIFMAIGLLFLPATILPAQLKNSKTQMAILCKTTPPSHPWVKTIFSPINSMSTTKKMVLGGAATASLGLAWWQRNILKEGFTGTSILTHSLNKSDYLTITGLGVTAITGGLLTKKPGESLGKAAAYSFGYFLLELIPILTASNTTLKKIFAAMTTPVRKIKALSKDDAEKLEETFTEEQQTINKLKLKSPTQEEEENLKKMQIELTKAATQCNKSDFASYDKCYNETKEAQRDLEVCTHTYKQLGGRHLVVTAVLEKLSDPTDPRIEKYKKDLTTLEKEIKEQTEKIKTATEIRRTNIGKTGTLAEPKEGSELEKILKTNKDVKAAHSQRVEFEKQLNNTYYYFPKFLGIFGSPGLGKTQIIKYLAYKFRKEAIFYELPKDPDAFDYFAQYVLTQSRVTGEHIFIFVDELESIAGRRQGDAKAQKLSSDFLSKILPILAEKTDKIHIIGVGNYFELIDAASQSRFSEFGLKIPDHQPIIFFDNNDLAFREALKEIQKIVGDGYQDVKDDVENFINKLISIPDISWREINKCIKGLRQNFVPFPQDFKAKLEKDLGDILKIKAEQELATVEKREKTEQKVEELDKRINNISATLKAQGLR